ncbi:MAG: DUF4105 domain-containing protein [Gammaproteobacteria bacterium]|nr:DUF4105 domain-containing protein [Gammaproteobacteria bacterium]MBQ0838363.1 DUF4105 domain-containing protein [Gammaproteobacteria bacterium]
MKTVLPVLFVFLCACSALKVYGSADEQYRFELQDLAIEKTLWLNRDWINLVHYKPSRASLLSTRSTTYSSFVDDTKFFLAKDGDSKPRDELLATLAAVFNSAELGDSHAQCRFPARLSWLSEQLKIDKHKLPKVECPLYKQWQSMVSVGSAVLVFPAHHLNSPSSMFGHTLLRIDPGAEREHSDWLAYGVNFGANIPAGDNSLLYAYKGLSGGYPGQFIVEPYFKKIQEYNRVENRDIWEYPLNLTARETHRLSTHLWELKDINFDYYFFTENCSYRLLELLEVARPSAELTDDYWLAAIPIDTVRSVINGGFVSAQQYRPSIATQLRYQLQTLGKSLQPLVVSLADNASVAEQEEFLSLSENQQYLLLQAAYNTVRYRRAKKPRDPLSAKQSLALLRAISAYPVHQKEVMPIPVSPENGHQSKRLTITSGREKDSNYSELGFRMAYHSLLDNRYGFLDGAQINMGSMALRHYDDDNVKLERLDLADIFSLTPRSEVFDSLSWRVYGGLERVNSEAERPLAMHISGGAGYAYDFSGSTVYTLLNTRVEHNREFNKALELALGAELGWLYQSQFGAGSIKASGLEFTGSEQRLDVSLEQDITLSVNHSLRFKAQRRWYDHYTASEFSLSYHYFFR